MVKLRGQDGVLGLLTVLILLVIFVGLYPTMDYLITLLLPTADTMTAAILRLFLPVMLIMILYTFLARYRQTGGV